MRAGLHVLLDREVALAGAAAPQGPLALTVARPRRDAGTGPRGAAARPLFRRPRLQPRRRARDAAFASVGADRRGALRGPRRGRRDPRRRRRPGRRARARRSPRRAGDRPPERSRGRAPIRSRPRDRRARLARRARPAGERAPLRDRTVLLAGARLRRRDQAGGGGAGRRARHRRPGPECRSHRPLRDDQRHECRDGAGRRGRSRARPGQARARRGRAQGRARRHERPGAAAASSPPREPAHSIPWRRRRPR